MTVTWPSSTTQTARRQASLARWKSSASSPKTASNQTLESLVLPLTSLESARRPGTPYYDASATKEKPKWGLVHVEFRKKFAVPIYLPELREMGKDGTGLENMQLLKQSRLSVSRVSEKEWEILCKVADEKANEAGLKHEEA